MDDRLIVSDLPTDTDKVIYRVENLAPDVAYVDFEITEDNRGKIGYHSGLSTLVVPAAFFDEVAGTWYKVTHIGSFAFDLCASLVCVIIPDCVIRIGYFAFQDCSKLERIVFGVNSQLAVIEAFAFSHCFNLENITLPGNVVYVGEAVFDDCTKLANVIFAGTEEKWERVRVCRANEPFIQVLGFRDGG